jgi:simple sugar transport system permease protein
MAVQATRPKSEKGASAPRVNQRQSLSSLMRRPETGALIATVSIYIFFAVFAGGAFTDAKGTATWLNPAAELGIIALPVGLLMIAGELDLSVGSVLAASSMTLAIVSGYWGNPIIVGILVALGLGLVVGFINGLIVTRSKVPSFVVTLATNFALSGLALWLTRALTGSTSVEIAPESWAKTVFGSYVNGDFEVAIFWWIGVIVIVGWILHVSRFGNWIFAVGGDLQSARATGIPTDRVKIGLFMASAFGASLVGIIQTIIYNSAQVANGQAFVFNSIIAVVIGGVLLTGGYGSVVGVTLGTLTFAIVGQGIYYTGWNPDLANLFLGVLLLIAVMMNNTFRRMALSYGPRKKKASTS